MKRTSPSDQQAAILSELGWDHWSVPAGLSQNWTHPDVCGTFNMPPTIVIVQQIIALFEEGCDG